MPETGITYSDAVCIYDLLVDLGARVTPADVAGAVTPFMSYELIRLLDSIKGEVIDRKLRAPSKSSSLQPMET